MKRVLSMFLAVLTVLLCFTAIPLYTAVAAETEIPVYLSSLTPYSATTGSGEGVRNNINLEGAQMSLNNAGSKIVFDKGVCIHAIAEVKYDISEYDAIRFAATVGMDDGSYGYKEYAGADFTVLADGVEIASTGTLRLEDAAYEINVEIPEGTRYLTIANGHGNDGSTWSEHCVWGNARILLDPSAGGVLQSAEAQVGSAVMYVGEEQNVIPAAKGLGGETMDVSKLNVTYSSSAPSVISVSSSGKLTALAEGKATVTCTVKQGGRSAEAKIALQSISKSSTSSFLVGSPEGKLSVLLENTANGLKYSVYLGGKAVVEESLVAHVTREVDFSSGLTYKSKSALREINETYKNYSGDRTEGNDHCFEQSFTFTKSAYEYTVTVRAYDDGYAVRSSISAEDGSELTLTVTDDKTSVKLPAGSTIWGTQIKDADLLKGNSYESGFPTIAIENAKGVNIMKAPIAKVSENTYVLLSEADLYGDLYIGSIFRGIGNNTLEMVAAPQKTTDFNGLTHAQIDAMSASQLQELKDEMEVVALSGKTFTFPWRYGVVGNLETIVESDLTENLNPRATGDFSWVEPGVTAWMWLSEGFSGQRNEQTIREYIDMASEFGWKYLILDEGWQPNSKVSGKTYDGYFDYFDELVEYGKEKGVSFIAWVKLHDLDTPEEREILTEWAGKGIAGIKFDFVESEGLDRMENVKAIYEKCAEVHLLVNEHGGNVPTGERATFPNVINRESVKGQEYGGVWCSDSTVWPYTRAAIGPTDITPKLEATGSNSMAHQLALFTVVESGMPCMASDTEVYLNCNVKSLLKKLPAAWDELQFVDGTVGGYTVLARRKGSEWFVGGITQIGRKLTVTFDFLESGKNYFATVYADGEDKNKVAVSSTTVNSASVLEIPCLDGGGFTILLTPESETVLPTDIVFENDTLDVMIGQSCGISFATVPANASAFDVSYSSSDKTVAGISSNGTVTALSMGVSIVTVSLPAIGLSKQLTVRVYDDSGYVKVGEKCTMQIIAGTLLNGKRFSDLTYTVENEDVASVDASGRVTGKKIGVTLLTASDGSGNTETIEVRVTEAPVVWETLNPDKDNPAVIDDPYTQTLPILTGDGGGRIRNVVLTDAPEGDFEISVKVSGGLFADFQTAGITAFADSDNFFAVTRRRHSYFGGNVFCVISRDKGALSEPNISDTDKDKDVYLKLVRKGNVFTSFYSFDGTNYVKLADAVSNSVGSNDRMKIGIIAFSGSYGSDKSATFSDFTVNGRKISFVPNETDELLLVPDEVECDTGKLEVPDTAEVYTSLGNKRTVKVTLDLTLVNKDIPGRYKATATYGDLTAEFEVVITEKGAKEDLNGDGKVSITDVTVLLDYLAGNQYAVVSGDPDLDGKNGVNISDVTALLDYLSTMTV